MKAELSRLPVGDPLQIDCRAGVEYGAAHQIVGNSVSTLTGSVSLSSFWEPLLRHDFSDLSCIQRQDGSTDTARKAEKKEKKEILLFFSVCAQNICFPWRSGVVSTHFEQVTYSFQMRLFLCLCPS